MGFSLQNKSLHGSRRGSPYSSDSCHCKCQAGNFIDSVTFPCTRFHDTYFTVRKSDIISEDWRDLWKSQVETPQGYQERAVVKNKFIFPSVHVFISCHAFHFHNFWISFPFSYIFDNNKEIMFLSTTCKYSEHGKILEGPPKKISFLQISQNVDGFRQNNKQKLLGFIILYNQNLIRYIFISTIYKKVYFSCNTKWHKFFSPAWISWKAQTST